MTKIIDLNTWPMAIIIRDSNNFTTIIEENISANIQQITDNNLSETEPQINAIRIHHINFTIPIMLRVK